MSVFDNRELFETVDLYEGNEGRGYYDERNARKDRIRQAGIWIGLLCVCGIIFIFCLYKSINDICLYYYGNSVTVSYDEFSSSQTEYLHFRGISARAFDVYDKDTGTIKLYYFGSDATKAQPLTQNVFWWSIDTFFGLMSILSGIMIYKNMKITHHYKGNENNQIEQINEKNPQ